MIYRDLLCHVIIDVIQWLPSGENALFTPEARQALDYAACDRFDAQGELRLLQG